MAILSIGMGCSYILLLFLLFGRRNGKIILNLYNLFILFFMLVYGFMFPVSLTLTSKGYNNDEFMVFFEDISMFDLLTYYVAVCLVTLPILFIFRQRRCKTQMDNLLFITQNKDFSGDIKIMIVAILMLLIGVISDYLYLRAYGSYANYLLYSRALRSGVSVIGNPFSFLIVFRGCVSFSSYLFFALRLSGTKKTTNTVLFIVSLILSMRIMYSNGGRMAFLIYFLVLIMYWIFFKFRPQYIDLKVVVNSIALGIAFVVGVIVIGNILARNETSNYVAQINREISFIYVNFFACLKKFSFEFCRFFIDTINFPVYLLPSSIWMSKLKLLTASDYMTIMTAGGIKGSEGIYGEMPVDLISLAYMQLGIVTIFILPMIYAFLYGKLCKSVNKISSANVKLVLATYVFLVVGIETIFYADPKHIVNRCFPFIVFLIIYNIVKRVRVSYK